MRVKEHTRAQAAFREALALSQDHSPAAVALACLGLALALGKDVEGGPEPAALEWVEVLGHSLKDAAAPAGGSATTTSVLPWALLALLYRMQGEQRQLFWCTAHCVLPGVADGLAAAPVSLPPRIIFTFSSTADTGRCSHCIAYSKTQS